MRPPEGSTLIDAYVLCLFSGCVPPQGVGLGGSLACSDSDLCSYMERHFLACISCVPQLMTRIRKAERRVRDLTTFCWIGCPWRS